MRPAKARGGVASMPDPESYDWVYRASIVKDQSTPHRPLLIASVPEYGLPSALVPVTEYFPTKVVPSIRVAFFDGKFIFAPADSAAVERSVMSRSCIDTTPQPFPPPVAAKLTAVVFPICTPVPIREPFVVDQRNS